MKCPSCGAAELIHDTCDVPYAYKGETTVIPSMTEELCPACDETVLGHEQDDRYGGLVSAFQRQVNATYVDPAHIAAVRRKLNLDQREAVEIFGGGVNALSRYETGKMKPSLALVKLLKLLDHHPNLLAKIRTA